MTTEEFLATIGKKISKAEELKAGDIVAKIIHNAPPFTFDDVYLYCVKRVQLKWEPKTFICPAVVLKVPSIGLRVKGGQPFYWHIYTPSPGSKYQNDWYQKDTLAELPEEEKAFFDPYYDLYLISHEDYVTLGNLINQVEVSSWSFLCQNRYSKANIFNFVADIQEDLQKAKKAYESIENKVRRWDVSELK